MTFWYSSYVINTQLYSFKRDFIKPSFNHIKKDHSICCVSSPLKYICVFSTISVQVTNVEFQKNGVTINSGTVAVDVGVPATLGCNIIPSTSRPPPTVIWYIGSAVIQNSTSTSFTVLASESDHNKEIYCKAYNLQSEDQAVESQKPKLYVKGIVKRLKKFKAK